MQVTMLKTYNRPPHRLYIEGHSYDLTDAELERIKKDLAAARVPGPYFQPVKTGPATAAERLADAKIRQADTANRLKDAQKALAKLDKLDPEEREKPGDANRLYRKAKLAVEGLTIELEELDGEIDGLEEAAKAEAKKQKK